MLVKDLSKRVKIVVDGKVLPSAVIVPRNASDKPDQSAPRQ